MQRLRQRQAATCLVRTSAMSGIRHGRKNKQQAADRSASEQECRTIQFLFVSIKNKGWMWDGMPRFECHPQRSPLIIARCTSYRLKWARWTARNLLTCLHNLIPGHRSREHSVCQGAGGKFMSMLLQACRATYPGSSLSSFTARPFLCILLHLAERAPRLQPVTTWRRVSLSGFLAISFFTHPSCPNCTDQLKPFFFPSMLLRSDYFFTSHKSYSDEFSDNLQIWSYH